MVKPFQLLIKPVAADCNLRCSYCFYRPVNAQFGGDAVRHRMSDDVLDGLIRDYLSHRFEVSVFCWQGGEPTLAGLDFFEKVVELEGKHGRGGQVVGNAFQTNGILIDRDWASFFARYRFLIGLSLDGPEKIHNTFRVNAKRKGSFDNVMAAAETMRGCGATFNVLTVVNSANQYHAKDVYRFFRKHGFNELQFIPCLEVDPKSGKPTDFSATAEGYGRFLTELFDAWIADDPSAVSIRVFDSCLGMAAGKPPDLCIFQERCGEYLLIEHNGDVYPCDFFVRPEMRLGNVTERPLARFFDATRVKNFARRKLKLDPSCKRCEWVANCHGGCPKEWVTADGSRAAKSIYCEANKLFFRHSMPEFRRLVGGE